MLCAAEYGTRAKWAVDVFSLPHNAVRRELMDLFKMMSDAASLGDALTAADVREMGAWWKVFHDFYLEYRGMEASIILPWVGAARASAPDLGYFLEALAEQRELIENLRTDAHNAFRRLYEALESGADLPDGAGGPASPSPTPWATSPAESWATSPTAASTIASPATPPGAPLPLLPPASAALSAGSAAPGVDGPTPAASSSATTANGGGAPAGPATVATLTVAACLSAVAFASKLVEYFGAQERFLPPVVHRHYADAKEKRRLITKMVDSVLGGRLPKDGVVLLVRWMEDLAELNVFVSKYLHSSARLAYPKWLARFEDGHRAHVERLHLRAVAARAGGGGGGAPAASAAWPRPVAATAAAAGVAHAKAQPPPAGTADPMLACAEPLSPVDRAA